MANELDEMTGPVNQQGRDVAVIEKQPKLEGRSMQMFLAPLPKDKAQK